LSVPGPSAKPQPTVPELPAVDDQQAKEVTTEVFAVASDEPEPEPEPKEVGLDPDESSNEVVADETVDPTKSKPEVRDDEPSPAEPKPEETIGS